MLTKFRAAGLIWPTLLALPTLVFLLGLGTWQMSRKAWKEALITQIDGRRNAAPGDLSALLARVLSMPPPKQGYLGGAEIESFNYTPYRVSGRFEHASERYYYAPDPRLGPGYQVFTPLHVTGGIVLMVNRGFVPEAMKDPKTRPQGNPEGPVDVAGLWRTPIPPGMFSPTNNPAKNIWFTVDLPGMSARPSLASVSAEGGGSAAAARGGAVLPFYLDALAEPANPGGWPRGGTTILTIPNRHLEYALTWYGLAATLIAVYFSFVASGLRSPERPDDP